MSNIVRNKRYQPSIYDDNLVTLYELPIKFIQCILLVNLCHVQTYLLQQTAATLGEMLYIWNYSMKL